MVEKQELSVGWPQRCYIFLEHDAIVSTTTINCAPVTPIKLAHFGVY